VGPAVSSTILAVAAWAQPKSAEADSGTSPWWWGVVVALVVAPIIMYAVKFIAERRRDRITRELIEESNREGPVPDLPKDFEIPQVIPRKGSRYAERRGR
jgi:hypothetical protein